ncbi:MAG TPA: hypothetical protein VHW24_03295 [Bryobacteraceae bacterium]|nr:hypothetical protein [Bryobacteraceae bacterium]
MDSQADADAGDESSKNPLVRRIELSDRWMIWLTAIIALATIANVLIFYLESESASNQISAIAEKADAIASNRSNQVIGNLNWSARSMQSTIDKNEQEFRETIAQGKKVLELNLRSVKLEQRPYIFTGEMGGYSVKNG